MSDIEFQDNQVVPDIEDETRYIDSHNEERTVPNIEIKKVISKDSEEDQVVPQMRR